MSQLWRNEGSEFLLNLLNSEIALCQTEKRLKDFSKNQIEGSVFANLVSVVTSHLCLALTH